MSGALLELISVRKAFAGAGGGATEAVRDVSLELREGQTLALVGESGAGKTTLARIAAGLLSQDAGSVKVEGAEIARMDRRARVALHRTVQMVFADPFASLNPRMTAATTIEEPLLVHRICAGGRARRERVVALLAQVGLHAETCARYPHQLSGGQRQRVALARALALDPRLLVADEPLSALDVSVQAQIINLLADLQRSRGLACLFISHDLRVVRRLAKRVAVLHRGRVVELADADDFFRGPAHPYSRELLGAMPSLAVPPRVA